MFSAVVGKVGKIYLVLYKCIQMDMSTVKSNYCPSHGSFFSDCEATFKGRFKLREHLRSHTQEKIVACPTCGGMFANNTKFFDHIRRQTTIEGIGRNVDCWIAICDLKLTP